MLYYVVREDLEDDEGELVVSAKAYPEDEAMKKYEDFTEKYPNAYVDVISIEDYYRFQGDVISGVIKPA